jgi:uncharacterized membrane protein YbhN (UPF0104 family)
MKRFLQGFIHWGILGTTGIVIAKTLYDHWPEVQTLQLQPLAGISLSFAIAIAIATQLWSAIVYKPLMSGFGFAWLLSSILPAPGGLGVFEASALQVLDPDLSPATLLGAVCMYRLVTLCAELMSAIAAYFVHEELLVVS